MGIECKMTLFSCPDVNACIDPVHLSSSCWPLCCRAAINVAATPAAQAPPFSSTPHTVMAVGPVGGYAGCNGSRALTDVFAYEPGTSLAVRRDRYAELTAEAEGHFKPSLLPEGTTTDAKKMTATVKPADFVPPVRG